MVFNVGDEVEVAAKVGVGVWISETIAKNSENGKYSFVEFKSENVVSFQAEIEFARIRPWPPIIKHITFGVLERVEALYSCG